MLIPDRLWHGRIFADAFNCPQPAWVSVVHMRTEVFIHDTRVEMGVAAKEYDPYFQHIARHVTMFCAMMGADELQEYGAEAVARVFALLYVVDTLCDNDHMIPQHAVRFLCGLASPVLSGADHSVRLANTLLGSLYASLRRISLRQDQLWLVEHPCLAFWRHGNLAQSIAQHYAHADDSAFWAMHAQSYIQHSTSSIQTRGTVGLIYAAQRLSDANLPLLSGVIHDASFMQVCSIVDALQRMWDDLGDREQDALGGQINICIHTHPLLFAAWAEQAQIGLSERSSVYNFVLNARWDDLRSWSVAYTRILLNTWQPQSECMPLLRILRRATEAGLANSYSST